MPTAAIRDRLAGEMRVVWDAEDLPAAEAALTALVAGDRRPAPRLAEWLTQNVLDGLSVLNLPPARRRRLRTTNPIEGLNQEVRRRARLVRVFPNEASVERPATAVLIEIDEEWETIQLPYIHWGRQEEPKCAPKIHMGTLRNRSAQHNLKLATVGTKLYLPASAFIHR